VIDVTSPISPEQQRVIDCLTVRVATMTPPQLLARMPSGVEEFGAANRGVATHVARAPMPPGEWTIAEVVDHMANHCTQARKILRKTGFSDRAPARDERTVEAR
jgi:hypothetical protein